MTLSTLRMAATRFAQAVVGDLPLPCVLCDELVEQWGLDDGIIHHVDGDWTNAARSNLEVMHPSCHKSHHMRRRWATLSPQQRSEAARQRWQRMTPESRRSHARKISEARTGMKFSKDHIENLKRARRVRVTCECGYENTKSAVTMHRKKMGH